MQFDEVVHLFADAGPPAIDSDQSTCDRQRISDALQPLAARERARYGRLVSANRMTFSTRNLFLRRSRDRGFKPELSFGGLA